MAKRTVKTKNSTEKSILDNPLMVSGIVIITVFIILLIPEILSISILQKEPKQIVEEPKKDSISEEPTKKGTNKKLVAIKESIEKAKDQSELENILEEIKSESTKSGIKDKAEIKELENLIARKTIKLKTKEDKFVQPEEQISTTYSQLLASSDFDLDKTRKLKINYTGFDRDLINSLDYYYKLCEHKVDYIVIMKELKKLGDNSYYEKADVLMRKKLKNKSIDEFESEDEYLLSNKAAWITATQETEIRRWGDEIDEELERIDADY
jgi:hypothetical protein